MSCFSCFGGGDRKEKKEKKEKEGSDDGSVSSRGTPPAKQEHHKHNNSVESVSKEALNQSIDAQTFTFRELASATKNFTPDHLLGEGGFGRVYKGCLEASGQTVAVKRLDRNGLEGNKEFLAQVSMISHLHHPNMVKLIGYCADGDQRLLVYEFMSRGSIKDHLIDLKPEQTPIDWYSRMKLAYGAAQGLEYLHDKANPPVIYRDLKSSNILLNEEFTPKLSDLGLADLGNMGGDKTHVASRVMGTYGYCAPEYDRAGHLTPKSDVYSFGVVLLELITGRRAIDTMKPTAEQNLVSWAQPMFKDQKKFPELVDPLLQNNYPAKGLNQAVGVAAMCLQEEASVRPLMADVVMALSFLIDPMPTPQPSPTHAAAPVVEHNKSSDSDSSDGGVVETIQLNKKKRASSKHERTSSSRRSSHSSSRRSSKHDSDHDSSKHGSSKHRSSKHGSSKHSRKSSHGSDDSGGSSWDGSDGSCAEEEEEEEMRHESPSEGFGSPHGSQHGSLRSVSSRVSRQSSRHYDESE